MSVPKRLISIVQAAQAAGWSYDETSHGHPRLSPPSGLTDTYRHGRPAAPVTFGKTPSDHRGDANVVATLRRLGVDIPHKGQSRKRKGPQ